MFVPFWSGSTLHRLALTVCSFVAAGSVSTLFAAEATLSKAEKEERVAAAERLLEEALVAEVDGRGEDRAALLAKAEALAPDLPAIQWQRGRVLVNGEWTPAEDVAVSSENAAALKGYVARRDAAAEAASEQLELADWCQEQGLAEQERAHLARVLTFEPHRPDVRARLGYVRVDEEWLSREELADAFAEQAQIQASLTRHGDELERLVLLLTAERKPVRERATEAIKAIRDVDAIPALERIVAARSEETATLVLDALAQMPEKEASLALARFASLSPSFSIRKQATEALRKRNFDHFVPEMLATMRGPIESRYSVERRPDTRLVYRQVVYREAMRSRETIVTDVVYANSQRSLFPNRAGLEFTRDRGGNDRDDQRVARAVADDMPFRRAYAEIELAYENAETHEVNHLLGRALDGVTGERFGSDAPAWWDWWNHYNELNESSPKPDNVQHRESWQSVGQEAYPDRVRISNSRQVQNLSCFAAGTPVLTNRGDVAIEQMRVGDLVLAQDVETGELAFKPVLETTVRPPVEILRLEYEGGSLRTTGGHPFWVSGEGWVHARRLQSGMELHTPTGTVRVSQVVSDGEEPAYNLIVADFANYFVGEARILSHDNSSRMPTDAIVPGLAQR